MRHFQRDLKSFLFPSAVSLDSFRVPYGAFHTMLGGKKLIILEIFTEFSEFLVLKEILNIKVFVINFS